MKWAAARIVESFSGTANAQERRLFVGDFLYPTADWNDITSPPGGLYAVQRGADLYKYLDAMKTVGTVAPLATCFVMCLHEQTVLLATSS